MTKKFEPDIKIVLDKDYDGFYEFYNENKENIYRNVVELFKKLTETDRDITYLMITTHIEGLLWESGFLVTREHSNEIKAPHFDKDILVNTILPFFENLEDYEFCSEIKKISDKLNV